MIINLMKLFTGNYDPFVKIEVIFTSKRQRMSFL